MITKPTMSGAVIMGRFFFSAKTARELCVADWRYNAWGNKFPLQHKDNRAPAWIAEQLGLRRFAFDTVLEGGAIESNGAGQLLSTEVVLLNPNRNGAVDREQITARLADGLGHRSGVVAARRSGR